MCVCVCVHARMMLGIKLRVLCLLTTKLLPLNYTPILGDCISGSGFSVGWTIGQWSYWAISSPSRLPWACLHGATISREEETCKASLALTQNWHIITIVKLINQSKSQASPDAKVLEWLPLSLGEAAESYHKRNIQSGGFGEFWLFLECTTLD
jgi:hypothetical protein